jgi:adenylate kinase
MSGDAISLRAPKLVIAGAPAAGKGTQCEQLKAKYNVVHLSTGDMLRAAVSDATALGVQAKEFMDAGRLVPDDLIIGVVCERLAQEDCVSRGWLLDGFPRTRAQADALKAAGMVPDCFILVDVPEDVLVERVTGRRTDPETGRIYHMTYSPPESDEVNARLVQRSDDTEEKVRVRYQDFRSNIDAIKDSYLDKTIWVDGTQAPEDVTFCLFSSIDHELAAESKFESETVVTTLEGGDVATAAAGGSSTSLFAHMHSPTTKLRPRRPKTTLRMFARG